MGKFFPTYSKYIDTSVSRQRTVIQHVWYVLSLSPVYFYSHTHSCKHTHAHRELLVAHDRSWFLPLPVEWPLEFPSPQSSSLFPAKTKQNRNAAVLPPPISSYLHMGRPPVCPRVGLRKGEHVFGSCCSVLSVQLEMYMCVCALMLRVGRASSELGALLKTGV